MTSSAPTAAGEWRSHWPLVLAATIGFSFHTIMTNSMGLFMEPIGEEFGWNRAQIFLGLTIVGLFTVPLSPVVGAMIDRWGSRRVAIPGIILMALSVAAFGLANGSYSQWIALWCIFGLVSLAVKSTIWTAAISGIFTAGRGLALGVTLSGQALSQILVPPVSFWLIEALGWRTAFAALGLGWGIVVLILVLLFLFDAHDRQRERSPGIAAAPISSLLPGLTLPNAARSVVLWRIGLASLLTMGFGYAVITHQVPILTEAGVTRGQAALLASLSGVAGILGKLGTGFFMDRRPAGAIGAITLAVSAIGYLLLLEAFRNPIVIVIAMMILGYSTGAKLQITAYLTGRYGGIRNFGKIFGVMVSLIGLGASSGPLVSGLIYDSFGSYSPLLIAGIFGSIVSGLLLLGLGPYPDWTAGERKVEEAAAKIAANVPAS